MTIQSITILGSTGSIGLSTLDVVSRHPDRYSIFALTANSQVALLAEQCLKYHPVFAAMRDEQSAEQLRQQLRAKGSKTQVVAGEEGLIAVASDANVDVVMAAIVGAAGLVPTLSAVEAGKKVLLANKEALVMAGALFMSAVKTNNAILLPIDSEHNAIFQCLPENYTDIESAGIKRILLTGSGGPFRTTPREQLANVTPKQACNHPNWSMGPKISVDSATMMNKGLEFIEACWLFSASPKEIDVVIHPQSVVHSMVEYRDGSVLAQLGNPDMRTPIAHALAWPHRIESGVSSLDLISSGSLEFFSPDYDHFPCLRLAMEAVEQGGTAQIVLNAANELAVDAFLKGKIAFTQIPNIIESVLGKADFVEPSCIDVVKQADLAARALANTELAKPINH